jgi:hypothetical protein
MSKFRIAWLDSGSEPKNPPNPDYPNGIDIDMSSGSFVVCKTDLPYPAKRCGFFSIECLICGSKVLVTTAGRTDDPRSVTVKCLRTRLQ